MADTLKLKRGDTAPAFRARCLDGTTPVSLASATGVRFLMKRSGAVALSGAMVVEDQTANTGWVHRNWGASDLAIAGYYSAEVEVTWSDGTVQTFPPEGQATIWVSADLG